MKPVSLLDDGTSASPSAVAAVALASRALARAVAMAVEVKAAAMGAGEKEAGLGAVATWAEKEEAATVLEVMAGAEKAVVAAEEVAKGGVAPRC